MTLEELYWLYKEKQLEQEKIILCHWKDQIGFSINNIDEFEEVLHETKEPVYLLNEESNEDTLLFDYFVMAKSEQPYLVVVRHPLMTNAYFKELPDKNLDMFVAKNGGVYRYLLADYGKGIKDYVIEMPPTLEEDIAAFCKERMPKGFTMKGGKAASYSVVLTNSTRYLDLGGQKNFVMYELNDIYPEWDSKRINNLTLSRKLWNDLKALGQE